MKKIVIFCLLAAALVSAQQKQRIAVLPAVGDLEPKMLILLTDKVREIATQHLPMEDFNILKQDAIVKLIGDEELYRACKEGVCIGDLARKTGSHYGARCDIVKLDDRLVMKFEIYSVNEDAIFEMFTDYNVKDFYGMLASLEARLPNTFRKLLSAPKSEPPKSALHQIKLMAAAEPPKPEPPQTDTPPPPLILNNDTAATEQRETMRKPYKYNRPRRFDNRLSLEIGGLLGLVNMDHRFSDDRLPDSSVNLVRGMFEEHGDGIYADVMCIAAGFSPNHVYMISHLLAKYPFDLTYVKIYPLLGGSWIHDFAFFVDDWQFTSGVRVDAGLGKIAYATTEYLHGFWSTSNLQSFKLGLGLDMGGRNFYWRPELRYQFIRMAFDEDRLNGMERRAAKTSTHNWGLYVGGGIIF